MKRAMLVVISVALLAYPIGEVYAQQGHNLLMRRVGEAGWTLTDPTVVAPYTWLTMWDNNGDQHWAWDLESNDVDELIAYAASASSILADGIVGSSQTTGQASCNTAIGAVNDVADVDTVVTALANIQGVIVAFDESGWENGAVVVTAFRVENHPQHDPVNEGTLRGFLWIFAHLNDSLNGQEGYNLPLEPFATLDVEVGTSNIRATFLGPQGSMGWFVEGTLQQSTLSDPDAEPVVLADWVPWGGVDFFYACSEPVQVPSTQLLLARIWTPVQNPEQGVNSRIGGSTLGDFQLNYDFKAKGYFSVTSQ